MGDLRRTIRCSNCGHEADLNLYSGLEVRELIVSGKCSHCGSAMQLNFNVVEKEAAPPPQEAQSMPSQSEDQGVNLDETLFGPEVPSDTLRDIMED